MLLAQVSDTHLLADPSAELWGVDTTSNLTSVLRTLPARPDALVITGDIAENGAEDGAEAAYRRALALTEGRADQRYFIAGNHDDPGTMQRVLGPVTPLRMVRIGSRWTMALLDSQWVGHEEGRITDETLAQLRDELAAVTTHVVLCVHHPPVSPCPNLACGMSNTDLLDVITCRDRVQLVLSGHVHQHFDTVRHGVRFVGAPSTFRQLRHGGDPHYQDTGEPPAALLLELLDDGNATSRVVCAR